MTRSAYRPITMRCGWRRTRLNCSASATPRARPPCCNSLMPSAPMPRSGSATRAQKHSSSRIPPACTSHWAADGGSRAPCRPHEPLAAGYVSRDTSPAAVPQQPDVCVAPGGALPGHLAVFGPAVNDRRIADDANVHIVDRQIGDSGRAYHLGDEALLVKERAIRAVAREILGEILLEPNVIARRHAANVAGVELLHEQILVCGISAVFRTFQGGGYHRRQIYSIPARGA